MPIRRPDVPRPTSSRRRKRSAIVAKVAHADQASGRAPAHVLQAKEKVREELVSAVREKYEAYLATAN